MSENSHLAEPTREDRVSCLSALTRWIDREGGTARGIRVIKAVADHDLKALTSGLDPLPCEPFIICSYLKADGDRLPPDAEPGDVIRNSKPEATLDNRLPRLLASWRQAGLQWQPKLVRVMGGGRSNPSLYRLDFLPVALEQLSIESEIGATATPVSGLSYSSEPVVAIWPLRFLFPPEGFPLSLRSFRTLTYLGLLFAMGATLIALGLFSIVLLGKRTPSASDYLAVVMFAIFGYLLWQSLRTMASVPAKRIVKCPMFLMATEEFHGQIQCIRRRDTKVPTGWISLVRISSQCPICGGTVELAEGKLDFPGRMVG